MGCLGETLGRVLRRKRPGSKRKADVVDKKDPEEHFMTIHEDWEHLLSTMNRADKAQLPQWIVRDLGDAFPGIESDPLVCGGESCIVRTRIPVWVLVQAETNRTSTRL